MVSKNPYTGDEFAKIEEFSETAIEKALVEADQQFQEWKKTGFEVRSKLMKKAAEELRVNKEEYAETITREMGKPITQSLAEIEKCAWVCEYYADNAEHHLSPSQIETDAQKSYVTYEPIGVILAIMPWNYPFWQVFRFAAPALMAGNIGVLKHASNVMQSANNIQKVFERAGFPKACFQNFPIGSKKVEQIIRDKRVKAVTITGSKPAGGSVASVAGEEIKKSVLELGGSNALVVFDNANINEAVKTCVQARFQNNGQSCIAGKRLLLQESIANEFLEKFVKAIKELRVGDPMDKETFISVLAREDLAKDLEDQVKRSIQAGAQVLLGGHRKGTFFEPTVLTNVTPEMAVFKDETFGPVISVTTFKDEEEAVKLVNMSDFGLGVSIFTEDLEWAEKMVSQFEDGAVFINELVKSDPRLPFGGTKTSGYGRELSVEGIREFVNRKTVYIRKISQTEKE